MIYYVVRITIYYRFATIFSFGICRIFVGIRTIISLPVPRCAEYSYSVSLPMSQFGLRENIITYSRLYILRVVVDPYRNSCEQCRLIIVVYYKDSNTPYVHECSIYRMIHRAYSPLFFFNSAVFENLIIEIIFK